LDRPPTFLTVPYVNRTDTNIVMLGMVMVAPADAGFNPEDKG
jgi:hypothetical protein